MDFSGLYYREMGRGCLAAILALGLALFLGLWIGRWANEAAWRQRLLDARLGRYAVDPATGVTEFQVGPEK